MEKKRVLFVVSTELCMGGVPSVIMLLVRNLHQYYQFDAVTLSVKSGYFDAEFRSYGGTIYRVESFQYLDHKVLYPYSFVQIQRAIRTILDNNTYDVIHCKSGWQDAPCLLEAERHGVPIRISHSHGSFPSWSGHNKIMCAYTRIAKRILLKHATARVACSDIAGGTLFEGHSFQNILNCVDIEYYQSVKPQAHNGINLLQIGYFCKLKNQLFSIQLLHQMRRFHVDARLSFVGYPTDLTYLEEMKELIQQYDLSNFVIFWEKDSDKHQIFATSDYCLLPSETEGLPLVALESQAAGVPCLMSDHICEDANVGAGFFLPYNDVDAWYQAIIEGLHPNHEELSKNLQKVSNEVYLEKIRTLYTETAADTGIFDNRKKD